MHVAARGSGVVISTRHRFLAMFLATIVGIAALSYYGFLALESAAIDAGRIHEDLDRLLVTSQIEDDVRDLGGGTTPDLLASLDRDMVRFAALPGDPSDDAVVQSFTQAARRARANPSPDLWLRAGTLIGEVEERIIRRSQKWEVTEHANRRARKLLAIGGLIVTLFGAASAIVFVRWRREQSATQDHLRRSDRLASLGTIAASVAHEINNPLATIAGCAAAVRDRLRRQPDACADSLEYLDMVLDETRRCTGIVRNLRDLAREGPAAMTSADLAELARSVVALLAMDRKGKRVDFSVLGEARLEAICDPDKLKQLLLNLLLNARDASEEGGTVTLSVERCAEDRARFVVSDHGRGLEKKEIARVFEPFHTDKTQGLGIGLFLCERIATSHGGTIRAESDGRGRGARFVVEFPTRTPRVVPADAVS